MEEINSLNQDTKNEIAKEQITQNEQSPTKINPPIVTYSTKVIQAPPITYSKLKFVSKISKSFS